ncbi:MAG TPA: hypothetical protein VJ783_15800 [Pirellulales bacterium]|nr:hypothetical protein [Pirellulales bacterium]
MQTLQVALIFLMGGWLTDVPAPPAKDGDAVKAAAEAHAREQAKRQVAAEARANDAKRRATALKVVRQFDAAFDQAKTYLQPFRERLELETHYVERACDLTDEQAAALQKQAAAVAEHAQSELAKALAGQQAQQRQAVVIVNGNAVAVPSGVSGEYLTGPTQAAHAELLRVIADTLPAEARAKLDEADRQRHERALAATRLAALAVLDEVLLLSTSQRDEISRLLDTAWTVPVVSGRNPILAGAQHAPEMLYSARLVLPKAKLAVLLRPAQQAAFQSLSAPASQVAPGGGPRLTRMNRPAAAVRLNPVGGAVRQANVMQIEVKVNGGQVAFGAVQSVTGAMRPANYLELMVDDATAACELSDEQRTKLLLAGRLDLKRVAPAPDDAVKGVGVNNAAGMVGQVRVVGRENNPAGVIVVEADQVRIDGGLAPAQAFTEPSSAYQKVLRGKLSDEQLGRLSAAQRQRLAMHQRAAVAAALQALDERVLLSAQQHQRLSDFLEAQLAKAEVNSSMARPADDALARMARISVRQIEPLFDDFQRPLAARLWQELCAAAPLVAPKPAILKPVIGDRAVQ